MKIQLMVSFVLSLLVALSAPAQELSAKTPKKKYIDLNNLRYSNRAQCAVDSETPTSSAFLILDGFNAGKLGNSVARLLAMDEASSVNDSMRDFRLTTTHLTLSIVEKLLKGQLPLLPLNIKDNPQALRYTELVKNCSDKVYCKDIESYLAQIWKISSQSGINPDSSEWTYVDNFSQSNFLRASASKPTSCYYLKKFSPLQGHLQNTELNAKTLESIAKAVLEKDKYLTSCYDISTGLDSRNAALQIDLGVNGKTWKTQGFDFWNSVKIYLSWAWRNAPEMDAMSARFGTIFRSLALEESMMLIPNGCQSISPPSCDSEFLSVNSLRELAKVSPTGEHNANVPGPVANELLDKGARSVNNDFLGTMSYGTAGEWVANFRKNYVQARGGMKSRFLTAVQTLNIIEDAYSADEIFQLILPLAKNTDASPALRNELFYLCTEARLAGDRRLDFLKSDIDRMSELSAMLKANTGTQRELLTHIQYFDALSPALVGACDELEKAKFWNVKDYVVNKSGFEAWAKELLSIPMHAEDAAYRPLVLNNSPLLVWDPKSTAEGNVICASGIDCARKVLKAMVDLYAVSTYVDAFLPVSPTAPTPSLFNPYAELKACKVYDPWFQQNRVRKRFAWDLANTVLFGWNALPIYIDVDYSAPKVTSFNQLVKDGVIKFDPNIEKSQMQTALVADFGPLLGAPCAIAVAPNANKGFNFLAFNGISVNYCDAADKKTGEVKKPNDIQRTPTEAHSYCGGCALNFVTVASAASSASSVITGGFNPFKFAIYMFRSFYRFATGMEDNVNIPRNHTVNLNYVTETYQKFYGSIPKECVDPLSLGLKCFQTICEAKAVEYFEQKFGATVKSIIIENVENDGNGKVAWIKSDYCDGSIALRFSCEGHAKLGEENFTPATTSGNMWGATSSCRRALNN